MPRFAERVPPIAKAAAPAAARLAPARPGVARQAGIAHALQLRAARAARVEAPAPQGGLPARLKAGIEAISGIEMGDVRVHRDSSEPARLGALALAKGCDIHLGPGQEYHLPHEAWHVVQQRQGRVTATAQLKGVALNEDGGLEKEADVMGARALQAAGSAAPLAQGKTAAPGGNRVAQAKMVRRGQVVEVAWYQWGSRAAHRLEDARETYVLRDDASVTANVIHALRADRKYLLGEEHGDGTWAQRTALWSSVDTMHEAGKAVPEAPAPEQGKGQALESLHAYTAQVAMMAQTHFRRAERFHAEWLASGANSVAAREATVEGVSRELGNGLKQLEQMGFILQRYRKFAADSEGLKPAARQRRAPALRLVSDLEELEPRIEALAKQAQELTDAMLKHGAEALDPSMAPISKQLEERSVLEEVVDEVLRVIKTGVDLTRIRELARVAGPADAADRQLDAVSAAFPMREDAMIANIKNARAPLLVQLGDKHVARVDAAIVESVPVRVGDDFAAMTRQEG